jgi:hypothetical protein
VVKSADSGLLAKRILFGLIHNEERRLTQRAPDVWESARFQAVCVA